MEFKSFLKVIYYLSIRYWRGINMNTRIDINNLILNCNDNYRLICGLDNKWKLENVNNLSFYCGCALLEFVFNKENLSDYYFNKALMNLKNANALCLESGLINIKGLALLYSENGKYYSKLNQQIDTMIVNNLSYIIENEKYMNFELTYGQTASCRYLLNIDEPIAHVYVKTLINKLLKTDLMIFDKSPQSMNKEELEFLPEGYFDIGLAHGIAGVLFLLADYYKSTKDSSAFVLINTIYEKILINTNIKQNKLILNGIENHTDSSVPIKSEYYSWCYGTLGIINALIYSNHIVPHSEITDNIIFFKQQLMKVDSIVFKNSSNCICHGYTGALLMLDNIFGSDFTNLPTYPFLINKINNVLESNYPNLTFDNFSHIDGCVSELLSALLFTIPTNEKEIFYRFFINIL